MARLNAKLHPELDEDIVSKLHSLKIYTVYDFMAHSCEDLMKKTGKNFVEIENILKSFYDKFGGEELNSLEVYEQEIRDVTSTGIKNLDELLEGGLCCGKIYEICGSSAAGKSQLCHWIMTHVTLNESSEVHYIDGSRNFSVSRIQMFLESKQCSNKMIGKVMSSIKVYRISKIHELFKIFSHLSKKSNKTYDELPKNLVFLDSISVLCATITSPTELNSILCNFASVCRYYINHFRAAAVIVNTIRAEFEERSFMEEDKVFNINMKPSLGNYWLTVPSIRILINQLENKKREISVWKSVLLENGKKILVVIKDEGIFPAA